MIPTMPAVILVRAGSQRLREKWRLPWGGVTLPEHTVRQCLACKYIDRVIVGTDSDDLLRIIQRRFGEGSREANSRNVEGHPRTVVTKRPVVPSDQGSLDGLRWVLEQHGLQASICMLVQTTFPFLNVFDMERLVETWYNSGAGRGLFLSKPGKPHEPAGAAWIVNPYSGYTNKSFVDVTSPCVDIDERKDYDAALEIARAQKP